jgi:uncharacterized protein (DUF2344 family)
MASCIKLLNDYFDFQLKQGLIIPEIIETLNQPILPHDLKEHISEKITEEGIRRCGQIVSTQRIIRYNKDMSSEMKF